MLSNETSSIRSLPAARSTYTNSGAASDFGADIDDVPTMDALERSLNSTKALREAKALTRAKAKQQRSKRQARDSQARSMNPASQHDITEDDWYLSGLSNEVKGAVFPIRESVLVGRAKESDFCLPIIRLSRRHAKLSLYNDGILIEDLQSSNGTYLNGRKVTNVIAKIGDTISFDDISFTLRGPVQEEQIHSDHTQIGNTLANDQTVVHDREAFQKALIQKQQEHEAELAAKVQQAQKIQKSSSARPGAIQTRADMGSMQQASSRPNKSSAISQQRKVLSHSDPKPINHLQPDVDLPDTKVAMVAAIVGSLLFAVIIIALIVLLV